MSEIFEQIKPNPEYHKTPDNESKEHFYLKQLAKVYLKGKYNCKYIGSEVFLGKSIDKSMKEDYPDLPYNQKKITDAVGVEERQLKHMSHEGVIRNIEVKVSMSDFKSGYSVMGDYNYIMTIRGRLDKDEIPSPIGLIEVSLDDLDVYYVKNKGIQIEGTALRQYPSRMNDSQYIIGSHEDYVNWVIKGIARKQTNQDIYNNPWIWWD